MLAKELSRKTIPSKLMLLQEWKNETFGEGINLTRSVFPLMLLSLSEDRVSPFST